MPFRLPARSLLVTLLVGLLARLLLMPFVLHVDTRFTGDIVAINQYAHLVVFNPDSLLRLSPLYPLLAYYTTAFFQFLFSPFSPPVSVEIFGSQAAMTWFASADVFRQLFFFKLWYLFFDLGAAYLLWCMFRDDQRKARLVLAFWLFNPIIIYNAYVHGQFDVAPIFFTVLALYCAQQKHSRWAVFFIGIAACYKNYPFFFLPPAVLILSRFWSERIKLFLLGTLPYALLALPRLGEYTHSISGYGDWFFRVGYDVGFGGQVYLFFALYMFLLWRIESARAQGFQALWQASFVTLLIYYPFSYFDLHYYAWLMPFAALYLADHPDSLKLYLFAFFCLLVCWLQTPAARFLAPVSPRYFLRLPSLMEVFSPHLPILFIMNVFRSFLAGTLLWLAWRVSRGLSGTPAAIADEPWR